MLDLTPKLLPEIFLGQLSLSFNVHRQPLQSSDFGKSYSCCVPLPYLFQMMINTFTLFFWYLLC